MYIILCTTATENKWDSLWTMMRSHGLADIQLYYLMRNDTSPASTGGFTYYISIYVRQMSRNKIPSIQHMILYNILHKTCCFFLFLVFGSIILCLFLRICQISTKSNVVYVISYRHYRYTRARTLYWTHAT